MQSTEITLSRVPDPAPFKNVKLCEGSTLCTSLGTFSIHYIVCCAYCRSHATQVFRPRGYATHVNVT